MVFINFSKIERAFFTKIEAKILYQIYESIGEILFDLGKGIEGLSLQSKKEEFIFRDKQISVKSRHYALI